MLAGVACKRGFQFVKDDFIDWQPISMTHQGGILERLAAK